jgi:hypothetical protein
LQTCRFSLFHNEEIAVVLCLPKGYEHQAALVLAVHTIAGHLVLAGECGYSAIEFLHPDGSSRRTECMDGVVFTELNPSDQSGQLRAVDAKGGPTAGQYRTSA